MSVSIGRHHIVLAGHASVEDAEPLLVALADHPEHGIDISELTRAHLAVVQLLHASRRPLLGRARDPFLRDMVLAGLVEVKES